jgi:phosphoribosyl-dephospho-CoA transferase
MAYVEVKRAAKLLLSMPEFSLVMEHILDQFDEELLSTDPNDPGALVAAAMRRRVMADVVNTVAEIAASTTET